MPLIGERSPVQRSNSVSDMGGAKRARTTDLLHAIEKPLGSLACGAPTGVSGSVRHGSSRGLRRSKARPTCRMRPPGESASANGRSHGHPACCSGLARDARCRRVAYRPAVK
jgi:hypothetical protein